MNNAPDRVRLFVRLAANLLVLCSISLAHADGPVGVASLPGGALFTDSDDGSGETWGRSAGRDFSFSSFNLSLFSQLAWGPVDANSVGIAMDGTINNGSQEILTFSNLTGNQATWVGQTQVEVFEANNTTSFRVVETRFVLTVTNGGVPVNLEINSVNGLPYVNVTTAGGAFVANLKMQARLAGESTWEGALDLFDQLSTTGDGIALTSFNHGFFFELAGGGGGLTLEEHDSNMFGQTESILGVLDFLTIETTNRLVDIGQKVSGIDVSGIDSRLLEVNSRINDLIAINSGTDQKVSEIDGRLLAVDGRINDLIALHSGTGQGAPTLNDIEQLVSNSRQELIQILTFLWGITPGGDGFPDPSTIPQISELSTQASLDDVATQIGNLFVQQGLAIADLNQGLFALQSRIDDLAATPELSLEVVGSQKSNSGLERLLILVRENGVPIDPSNFTVNAIVENARAGFAPVSVAFTQTGLGVGLVEINVELTGPLASAQILHITAEHPHSDGTMHAGAAIVGK